MAKVKFSGKIKLIGKKIILREVRDSDIRSIIRFAKVKKVSKFTDLPHPFSLKDAYKLIGEIRHGIKTGESYQLGIELPSIKKVIGIIGLTNIDEHKKAELEYWLGRKYWGQGIAKEAVKLILNFGFRKLRLNRIYAKTVPENINSWKLLKKCGFSYEGRLRETLFEEGRFVDLLVYSILRKEY